MNRTFLLLLGVAALAGGGYYLYKSGKIVGSPTFASSGSPYVITPKIAPMQQLNLSGTSGYRW